MRLDLPKDPPSTITPEAFFRQRRALLRHLAALPAYASLLSFSNLARAENCKVPYDTRINEPLTREYDITHYNNFYEYSTDKEAVAHLARNLEKRPWTLRVEGECEEPQDFDIDTLLKRFPSEERIYRLRCVEGWSMVVPWQGFSLCKLLNRVKPLANAKYVGFESLHRPDILFGQRTDRLPWPYQEGLRLDEAMHPLTILATGLYGKPLPNQNGAPVRLVVPWKYGFKSAKSVVRIRLLSERPPTSWHTANPREYGFYANVNPAVPHPRWSQAREVRIGELRKRPTELFNGYAESVAPLYAAENVNSLW